MGEATLWTKPGVAQHKAWGTIRSATVYWLPVKLVPSKFLRWYISWVKHGILGITRMKQVGLTRPVQIQIWLCGCRVNTERLPRAQCVHRRWTQHRDNSGCPSSSHPEATQCSLSLYVSGAFWAIGCLSELNVSAWEPESLCTGSLKGCCGFQPPSHLDRIPTNFYSHMLCGLLFPALVL